MMNDDTNILSVEDENTPTFHFHVLCVFNVEAALVDAARRGERGVFGQRRAVLHGAGMVGDECWWIKLWLQKFGNPMLSLLANQ